MKSLSLISHELHGSMHKQIFHDQLHFMQRKLQFLIIQTASNIQIHAKQTNGSSIFNMIYIYRH